MPISKPSISIDSNDWVLISEKAATIQIRLGSCSIWFGDKPDITVTASCEGIELKIDAVSKISFTDDSQCWARASDLHKSARLSVTEH